MATKKTSARRATSKKSSRKARVSSWPRQNALKFEMKLRVPKDNPHRNGTDQYQRYEHLKRSKTVGAALDPVRNKVKGKALESWHLNRRMLRNLVHDKVAKVG